MNILNMFWHQEKKNKRLTGSAWKNPWDRICSKYDSTAYRPSLRKIRLIIRGISSAKKMSHIKMISDGIRQRLYWPLPINSQFIQSLYLVYFDSRDIFHSQNLIVIPEGFKKDNNNNTHKISTSSKVISAEILNLWCGVFPYYCWDFHIIHVLEVTCK